MTDTQDAPLYKDPSAPLDARVEDLLRRMTLEEKVSQIIDDAPPVPRLDIPEYHWWGECLHGIARAGKATIFPQAIGLGATFDADLVKRVAAAIGDEARAKYNAAIAAGRRRQYWGLTFWTPNINIFRDPRWGRGQETYGEDPFLTGLLGAAFVRGLQGDGPVMKAAACAKHYAVHSGPEPDRHDFDAVVSKKDLWETYLPAFKACVDAGVEAVMGAYNRVNGEPACASRMLLGEILRGKWGFNGHVVSDCGAIEDIHARHHFTGKPVESVALAIKRGCDLNCGVCYKQAGSAVLGGLLPEADLDNAVRNLLRTRFRLGLFDPADSDPYRHIGPSVVDSPRHRRLAREAAVKSIVLLRNNGVLPLSKDLAQIHVVGPGATSTELLWANYHGVNDRLVSVLEGIVGRVGPTTGLHYKEGFFINAPQDGGHLWGFGNAASSDVVIAVMGLTKLFESEEGDAVLSENNGDRVNIGLPPNQKAFLERLSAKCREHGKPLVVILHGGSAIAAPELETLADAVLMMWYPGEEGGSAVADVLFGDVSPSGRLPVTFVKSVDDLPPYEDYSMERRTYRYMREEPLYPFGFGLSYTRFEYQGLKLSRRKVKAGEPLRATVTVANIGERRGEEVVQLYVTGLDASVRAPRWSLKAVKRVAIAPGKSRRVSFEVTPEMLALVDENGDSRVEPGRFRLTTGGSSPGQRSTDLGAPRPAEADLQVI